MNSRVLYTITFASWLVVLVQRLAHVSIGSPADAVFGFAIGATIGTVITWLGERGHVRHD